MIYLIDDNFLNSFLVIFLYFFEILFLITGLLVITSKNPIISILYLIGLFTLISIYLILSGINFIGISYLLVYIGAVSILFLFILMLIDIRISELHSNTMNNIVLGIILGIFIYIPINSIFVNLGISDGMLSIYKNFFNINYSLKKNIIHNSWEGFIIENTDINVIGNILYTNISLWLIISLLILLLAMVGAIVINLDVKNK